MANSGSPGDKKLTTPQRRAIAALLSARSVSDAARTASVSERSLYRWLSENSAFQSELQRQETLLVDATLASLSGELATSASTLADIRDDVMVSESVRLRASVALVDVLLRLQELRALTARLDRLEGLICARSE